MTNNTTHTLTTTMVALKRALSLIPTTRMAVITRAIRNAGRLNPTSTPKMVGAFNNSLARSASTADCAPMISVSFRRNACVPGTRLGSAATAICRATIFSAVFSAVQWSHGHLPCHDILGGFQRGPMVVRQPQRHLDLEYVQQFDKVV